MGSTDSGPLIVYFSQQGDTARFVEALGLEAIRITPGNAATLVPGRDYVLVLPSYGAGSARRAVHPKVARFLSDPVNQQHCVATIGGGNSIYGEFFAYAADFVARKLSVDTGRVVPVLFKFELFGLPGEAEACRDTITRFWENKTGEGVKHDAVQ